MKKISKALNLILVASLLFPGGAMATSQDDVKAAINDTVWYVSDYQGSNCTVGSATDLVGRDNPEKVFNFFIGKGLSAEQAAGIVGNLMAESYDRVDPTAQQDKSSRTTPKDGVGFGIHQWTFTPRQAPLVAFAAKMGLPVNSLTPQVNFLWAELSGKVDPPYKSDDYSSALEKLKNTHTVEDATRIFMIFVEGPADQSQSAIDGRAAKAKTVLAKYGNNQAASPTSSAGDAIGSCQSTNGVIAGDIVATAINLAWRPGESGFNLSSPKPSYRTAWDGASNYTDCGAFVASVMIATQADKNYPKVSTATQIAYLKSHPEKYSIIDHPTKESQLSPGDILIYSNAPAGHTLLYLGPQKDGYVVAEASLGDHVPILNPAGSLTYMFGMPGVIAAHIIR